MEYPPTTVKSKLLHILEEKAESIAEKVKGYREHLHQNPELSFEEFETMDFVSKVLTDLNIEHETQVAGTGIIGFIRGRHFKEVPHVVLRADLDALPILEENEVKYVSRKPGIMHACGHDVHTSVLLGVAEILKSMEADLDYPVQLLFQPGEEKAPGGASLMIEAGALKRNPVKAIYGMHVHPEMNVGSVGFRSGLYMASCDEIHLEIIGKGGHAAMPHLCIDPIQVGAQIVRDLPLKLHKKCDPKTPMVISFGHFEAIGATNVIPGKAIIKGTFRTMNEVWRASALEKIESYCLKLSEETKADIQLTIVKGYPYLENDPETTEDQRAKAKQLLGVEKVEELPIRLTAEDFSFYSQIVPACFFRLGVRNETKGIVYGVHHPRFDIDPQAILIGMKTMALTAFELGSLEA